MGNSKSLEIAKQFLGKEVEIIIDRKRGSKHPEFGFVYEVNYGYIMFSPCRSCRREQLKGVVW